MWGITTKVKTATWYGEKVGGELGVKTVYCRGVTRCPNWATGALDGTRKSSARSASSLTSSPEPPAEPTRDPEDAELSATDESALLVASYEPVEEGTSMTMEEIEEIDGELR